MGAQGSTTVDFGVHPGGSDTSVAITGQPSIVSGSLVEAWLYPVDTADHSADEHIMAKGFLGVTAGLIVAGTGFTIYAIAHDQKFEAEADRTSDSLYGQRRDTQWLWGLWTVAWAWN